MYDSAHSKELQTAIATQLTFQQEQIKDLCRVFIIAMEALSREFRTSCPWELQYANDFVIVAESVYELKVNFKNWKDGLEEKAIKVNGKNKMICFRHDVSKLMIASVKFPLGVGMKGVGANLTLCLSCRNWVHKRCSAITTSLRNCEHFICKTFLTTIGGVDPFSTCITWCCDCSYRISLESFSRTSTNTHKQRYISCKPQKSIYSLCLYESET